MDSNSSPQVDKPEVRTRFAPSPTGLLHIGGLRTALFNYLYAKKHNGTFILRLEDTDRERFVQEGIEQIFNSLEWVGLEPDEGVWYEEKPGKHSPYVQSLRLDHYRKYAQDLIERGDAYYSYITPEEFAARREEAIALKKPFVYKQSMEPKDHPRSTSKVPIRLKVKPGSTAWADVVRGSFESDNSLIDDFIIIKADGFPTYNFANVVDDYLMRISHVIRGDEFISSTAKHAMLYDYFDWERPEFIHLPPILGSDGKKKMSKRDGDVDVLEYKAKGYLPDAVINFLALLGWNDGSEQEIFSRDELIKKFDLAQIQKSPARFDKERLDWMNGEYIRAMNDKTLSEKLKSYIPSGWMTNASYFNEVLNLDKERLKTLADSRYLMEIFFEKPKVDKNLLTQKDALEDIKKWLQKSVDVLESVEFEHDKLESAMRELSEDLDVKTGSLFYAIRISLTGRTEAPGLFDLMATLGKKETIERIKKIFSE